MSYLSDAPSSVTAMIDGIPASLAESCISGDLLKVKTLYSEYIDAEPQSRSFTLNQMAILSARNARTEVLSFCFDEGLTLNPHHVNDPVVYAGYDADSIAVMQILLDRGRMDVNKYQECEGSPLVMACFNGNLKLVNFLLKRGADPNNRYFRSPYEALVWTIIGHKASMDILGLLLDSGTRVKGTGALIAAAEHGELEASKLLVEHGLKTSDLDLEEVEEYGEHGARKADHNGTALYKAAANGYLQIFELLLSSGANPGFVDRQGRSVSDIALENGHDRIVQRLKQQSV